ncbi:HMG-box [Atractiella rhizophila]|nr:HMG-box [Atractiella rhizophila]
MEADAAPVKRARKEGAVREKKEKKERDPNAPKKPPGAYLMYQNGMIEKMKTENPGMTWTELQKQIGSDWKDLNDEQKKEYQDKHARLLETYKEDMEEYQKAHPELVKEKKERKTKEKTSEAEKEKPVAKDKGKEKEKKEKPVSKVVRGPFLPVYRDNPN